MLFDRALAAHASIATSQVEDLMQMQNCNIMNLPENYNQKYCSFETRLSRLLLFLTST
jgi:hypothetical protein